MSNNVINIQQLPKEAVAKFVNDAAEMEVNSYSLKETAKTIKKEIDDKKASESKQLENKSRELKNQKSRYEELREKAQNYTPKKHQKDDPMVYAIIGAFLDQSVSAVFGTLMLVIACTAALAVAVFSIFAEQIPASFPPWSYMEIIFFIFAAFSIIFVIVFGKRAFKKQYKETTQAIYDQAEKEKEQLDKLQAEYDKLIMIHRHNQTKNNNLCNHATALEKSAAEIDTALQKHYSLGIIPPDYRDMVHVLYINRAFRNDQVDTMREATLLCDRDIQHSEVIGGLHEIASAISSLAPVLEDISYKISIMNAELKSIADGQDKLVSETESARYAAESVKNTQETLVWYEQQKWYRANS